MEAKKLQKEQMRKEACARKLQAKYRARLAHKKMEALRAEKHRLMEEGCAIKLQVCRGSQNSVSGMSIVHSFVLLQLVEIAYPFTHSACITMVFEINMCYYTKQTSHTMWTTYCTIQDKGCYYPNSLMFIFVCI